MFKLKANFVNNGKIFDNIYQYTKLYKELTEHIKAAASKVWLKNYGYMNSTKLVLKE